MGGNTWSTQQDPKAAENIPSSPRPQRDGEFEIVK